LEPHRRWADRRECALGLSRALRFEEDEEVFVHPRDPRKRIDAIRSSRRVEIVLGGAVLADSRRAVPECAKIEGLVSFFNEKVDAIRVDGKVVPKPMTKCS
jgi:uncharacterized protein (DUF427 family)